MLVVWYRQNRAADAEYPSQYCFHFFQASFCKEFAERGQVASEDGFLRVWRTADEYKS